MRPLLEIGTYLGQSYGFNPVTIKLTEIFEIGVRFDSPIRLSEARRPIFSDVQKLLTFMSGVDVRLPCRKLIDLLPASGHRVLDDLATVWLEAPPDHIEDSEDRAHPEKVLVPIELFTDTVLGEWMALSGRAPQVIDLLQSSFHGQKTTVDQRFLSLAQAIESFHRAHFGGTHLPEDKWESLSDEIQSVVKEKLCREDEAEARKALQSKLRYLNEITLGARISFLIEWSEAESLGIIRNSSKFIKVVKATRNYLTHFGEPDSDALEPSGHMANTCEQMQCFLEVCILKQLAFSREQIKEATQSNERHGAIRLNLMPNIY